ncbi:response regulator transcription factor [Tritonibacter mobilis]|jgi:DNA-binding NarL/FixJ family response regulator|nr:response regulator transcription factor [Tritonibacter mobilis]
MVGSLVSVLIVEDVPEVAAWLEKVVHLAFPDSVCAQARSLKQAQKLLTSEVFDLHVLDLNLPDGAGTALVPHIRQQSNDAICVVATVSGDDASIVEALSYGINGYLLKDQPHATLAMQLKQISMGVPSLSPAIAQRLMRHFSETVMVSGEAPLTPREAEVLSLIGRGLRNAEVAAELNISTNTVSGYIKQVYSKLGISSRAEAAWHSKRLGLW